MWRQIYDAKGQSAFQTSARSQLPGPEGPKGGSALQALRFLGIGHRGFTHSHYLPSYTPFVTTFQFKKNQTRLFSEIVLSPSVGKKNQSSPLIAIPRPEGRGSPVALSVPKPRSLAGKVSQTPVCYMPNWNHWEWFMKHKNLLYFPSRYTYLPTAFFLETEWLFLACLCVSDFSVKRKDIFK